MNRDFLSNFEPVRSRKTEHAQAASNDSPPDEGMYANGEYPQNVCFVWPDGQRRFFEYSRMDSGEIDAEAETIQLYFGADRVQLIGVRLLSLFTSFMRHRQKFVYCDDARYNSLADNEPAVNEITILKQS